MSRSSRIFLTLLFSASTLFAGIAASTHSYCTGGSNCEVSSVMATCGCHGNQPRDQKSGQPAQKDHDQNNCLTCRLIAEFHAEIPMNIELEFDSMISCLVVVEAATFTIQRFTLFRGRAPPTV